MAVYSKKEIRPAPSSAKGLTFWMRENLFSSPLNRGFNDFRCGFAHVGHPSVY